MVRALSVLVCLGLIAGCCYKFSTEDVMSGESMEKQWAIMGGDIEREIDVVEKYHDKSWKKEAQVTMLQGKGPLLGSDIMTPEAFAKMDELLGRFHNITVKTASGTSFSTEDLCARGSMPDYPGNADACAAWEATNMTDASLRMACFPSPAFPCLAVGPFHCFAEYFQHLPASYKPLDPVIDQILPPSRFGRPYTGRPSYKSMSPAQMKEQVSKKSAVTGLRGCEWWTGSATFQPDLWSGNVEWSVDGALVTKVPAIRWTLWYDAVPRIKFRTALTRPGVSEADIAEAQRLHDSAWHAEVEAFASQSDDLEVLNIGPFTVDDLKEENEKPRGGLMFLGVALMFVWICVSLSDFQNPTKSRVLLAHKGMCAVLLVIPASFGLWLLLGWKLNAVMVSALPFLALGLGVDDMFVLIRYFSELGEDYITDTDVPEILGELLARGGGGATLTSLCNTVAFGLGALLPVSALADFCLGAALISLMNYMVVFTLFLVMIVWEIHRVKARQIEYSPVTCLCHRRAQRREAQGDRRPSRSGLEERCVAFLKDRVSPLLARPPVRVAVSLSALGLVVLSCASVAANREIGFSVSELAPQGSRMERSLEVLMDDFQTFPAQICFFDIDVPKSQTAMLELYDKVTTSSKATPFNLPPYLTMFSFYVLGKSARAVPGVANTTYGDLGWTLDVSWTHPAYAPRGIVTSDSAVFQRAFSQWTEMPLDDPALALRPGGNDFLTADMVNAKEFSLDGSRLKFSFFPFFQTGLDNQQMYVDAIQEIRNIFADSGIPREKAFPYGPTFTFWAVFLELDPILVRSFLIDLAVICIITFVLLRSATAAIASTLACGIIVVMVYGGTVAFARFNYFVVGLLLASLGISVEFTSHFIAAFEHSAGPLSDRLGSAMSQTAPAVVYGAVSTFLGVLPLALSPITFAVKYFFGMFALLVGAGLLTGLVLLPGLLALLSPLSDLTKRESDHAASIPAAPAPTILQTHGSAESDQKAISV
jgi:hypothetical protein